MEEPLWPWLVSKIAPKKLSCEWAGSDARYPMAHKFSVGEEIPPPYTGTNHRWVILRCQKCGHVNYASKHCPYGWGLYFDIGEE